MHLLHTSYMCNTIPQHTSLIKAPLSQTKAGSPVPSQDPPRPSDLELLHHFLRLVYLHSASVTKVTAKKGLGSSHQKLTRLGMFVQKMSIVFLVYMGKLLHGMTAQKQYRYLNQYFLKNQPTLLYKSHFSPPSLLLESPHGPLMKVTKLSVLCLLKITEQLRHN